MKTQATDKYHHNKSQSKASTATNRQSTIEKRKVLVECELALREHTQVEINSNTTLCACSKRGHEVTKEHGHNERKESEEVTQSQGTSLLPI